MRIQNVSPQFRVPYFATQRPRVAATAVRVPPERKANRNLHFTAEAYDSIGLRCRNAVELELGRRDGWNTRVVTS